MAFKIKAADQKRIDAAFGEPQRSLRVRLIAAVMAAASFGTPDAKSPARSWANQWWTWERRPRLLAALTLREAGHNHLTTPLFRGERTHLRAPCTVSNRPVTPATWCATFTNSARRHELLRGDCTADPIAPARENR